MSEDVSTDIHPVVWCNKSHAMKLPKWSTFFQTDTVIKPSSAKAEGFFLFWSILLLTSSHLEVYLELSAMLQ